MAFCRSASSEMPCSASKIFTCLLLLFGLNASAQALYTKPWLGNVYELEWQGAFTYSRFHKVADAAVQLKHPFNSRFYLMDLAFTASAVFDMQAEIEFADTSRQSFEWQSVALQGRYLWLNDIIGDPCSLITGVNARAVHRHSLHDPSCPYHYEYNFELTTAIGKEYSNEGDWTMRTYGLGGIGIANQGSPWLRALGVWQINRNDRHRFNLGINGYFGMGHKRHVNVNHFNGWAHVHHQSIDLSAGYEYHMQIWGTVGLQYAYRIFANSFPEHVNFITLFYRLPFSFF
jgi:hypothetical protein